MILITDIRLTVSKYLCKREYLGQARTHRKARINRKWRKRYGIKFSKCPGVCYQVSGMGFICCPCVKAAVEREMLIFGGATG